MRKAADIFRILGSVIISNKTVRKHVHSPPATVMVSSGYFVYDEQ